MMAADAPDNSDELDDERRARESEQKQQEADERRRDREKVLEARQLESRREAESSLTLGSASLKGGPEVSAKTLKTKLGE